MRHASTHEWRNYTTTGQMPTELGARMLEEMRLQ